MVTFVFDASAVLRYLDGEAGTERVLQILDRFFKDSILITADFDMKPAERLLNIAFLPAKPKPSIPPSA